MILTTGGDYTPLNENVLNPNSLEYVVEAVQSSIFGVELYPTIYRKAAAYMFFIINDHIFLDGCKRTGAMVAISFLEINGIFLSENVTSDDIENLAINVANSSISLDELEEWFQNNSVVIEE